jgi:hypothetical protein
MHEHIEFPLTPLVSSVLPGHSFVKTVTGECEECEAESMDFILRGWILLLVVALLLCCGSWQAFKRYREEIDELLDRLTSKFKITSGFVFSILLSFITAGCL